MLAQNFLTPAELRIPDIQFEALVKVLGMLERGELRHVDVSEVKAAWLTTPVAGLFNMNWWSTKADCGTVCCIGGTAEAVGQFKFDDITEGLGRLFYGIPSGAYKKITTAQAAFALRSYLTTGEPNWADALAE